MLTDASLLRFKIGRRLLYLAAGVAVFMAAGSIGAATELTPDEAAQMRDEFENEIAGIDQNGIFVHNTVIAFSMFIPGAGAAFGGVSGYFTGTVLAALALESSAISGIPPPLLLFFLLLTPFGAMEVITYGLAMSRSGMLVRELAKKKPWKSRLAARQFFDEEAVPTLIELGIAPAVLFAAAIIEWQFIQAFGGIEQLGRF